MLFGPRVALESEPDYERRYIVLPRVLLLFRFYAPHYGTLFGIPSFVSFFFFSLSLLFPMLLYSRNTHTLVRIVRNINGTFGKETQSAYSCIFLSFVHEQGSRARLRAREGEHD